jgi:hypothetical protein
MMALSIFGFFNKCVYVRTLGGNVGDGSTNYNDCFSFLNSRLSVAANDLRRKRYGLNVKYADDCIGWAHECRLEGEKLGDYDG